MITHRLLLPLALLLVALSSCSAVADDIDFGRDVQPILSDRCYTCHGPDESERMGGTDGLRLDTEEGMFADMGGYTVIQRGKPEESEFIRRLKVDVDSGEIMPPEETGKRLSDYIKPGSVDYLNARRIVNGTDRAEQIAGYAREYERALRVGMDG